MKRIKTIISKGRDYRIAIKIETNTKWLLRDEADILVNILADDAMNSLSRVRYYSTPISKIKVK